MIEAFSREFFGIVFGDVEKFTVWWFDFRKFFFGLKSDRYGLYNKKLLSMRCFVVFGSF